MTQVALSAASAREHVWIRHLLALAFALVFVTGCFFGTVTTATSVWWVSPTYSHCFLILPISMWLIWEKREQLSALTPRVDLRALGLLPLFGLLWWTGELSTINELRQVAIVGMMQCAVLTFLGLKVSRLIVFPILYLYFLVPTGEYLIGPMQTFATRFVDLSLSLLAIPHYTQGTVFELTNGRFEIAEACAGLRFLIATVTLGVLFCYLMFRKWYKIALYLFASVTIPLIANGLRCVGIILLAHFTNNEYGAGADHLVYGWGFNIAILLLLFFLGARFRDHWEDTHPKPIVFGGPPEPTLRVIAALAGLVVLVAVAPAAAHWRDVQTVAPERTVAVLDLQLDGWIKGPIVGRWQPDYPGADAIQKSSFLEVDEQAIAPVDLFVGYYVRSRTGHSLTSHVNKLWDVRAWTEVESRGQIASISNSGGIKIQEEIIANGSERRMIWATYWVDHQFTSSLFWVKLLQAKAGLLGRDGSEAVVSASTVIDSTDEAARGRLRKALRAFKELSDGGLGADAPLRAHQG